MNTFSAIKQLFDITADNGFQEKEILEYKNFCENIPQILIEFYTQLGKVEKLNQTQDQLLEPKKLKWSTNKDYLIFYIENQYVCVWGISKNDLNSENPPVYVSYDEVSWQIETKNLLDFLNAMANLQAVFSLEFSSEEFVYINKDELKIIENNFKKRDFYFSEWIGISFYGNFGNDVIAVMKNNQNYDMIYASNNKNQFETMHKILDKLGG